MSVGWIMRRGEPVRARQLPPYGGDITNRPDWDDDYEQAQEERRAMEREPRDPWRRPRGKEPTTVADLEWWH